MWCASSSWSFPVEPCPQCLSPCPAATRRKPLPRYSVLLRQWVCQFPALCMKHALMCVCRGCLVRAFWCIYLCTHTGVHKHGLTNALGALHLQCCVRIHPWLPIPGHVAILACASLAASLLHPQLCTCAGRGSASVAACNGPCRL